MIPKTRALFRLVAISGVLAGSAVSLAPLAAAGPSDQQQAPTSCQVHELPLPEGTSAGSTTGASPDGRTLLGMTYNQQGETVVVIWRDGKIVDTIEDPPATLSDVNSKGVAVGGNEQKSWVYDNGEFRELPAGTAPTAINNGGQMAGIRSDNGESFYVPVTWKPGSDKPVDLPGPLGNPYDISENGTIVGKAHTDAGEEPYIWHPEGPSGPLPRPQGTPEGDQLSAQEISGPWVVGISTGQGSLQRWNLETGTAETIKGTTSVGSNTGINERGWVVGSQQGGTQAVMLAEGKVVPLPGVEGYTTYPNSINADGTVISGNAVQPKGSSKPVYWTCS